MDLTKEEINYVKIYQGRTSNVGTDNPDKLAQLQHENINRFLRFIKDPDSVDLKDIKISNVQDIIYMIHTLCELAGKSAIEFKLNRDEFYQTLIDRSFYRYENVNNLPNYNEGCLSNFKSTGINKSNIAWFASADKILLNYKMKGFCPIIPVNIIVNRSSKIDIESAWFDDEQEYLFPPFLDCRIEGNNTEVGIFKEDTFDTSDVESCMIACHEIEEKFNQKFEEDQKAGIVSEQLKKYCKVIYQYLYTFSRIGYNHYKEIYNDEDKLQAWKEETETSLEERTQSLLSELSSENNATRSDKELEDMMQCMEEVLNDTNTKTK